MHVLCLHECFHIQDKDCVSFNLVIKVLKKIQPWYLFNLFIIHVNRKSYQFGTVHKHITIAATIKNFQKVMQYARLCTTMSTNGIIGKQKVQFQHLYQIYLSGTSMYLLANVLMKNNK